MMPRLITLGIALLSIVSVSAQLISPVSNKAKWGKVAAEHVEVYAQDNELAATNKVARLAELARYELGILFDYRPTGKYKLVYYPSAQAFQNSNFPFGERKAEPGRIYFPEGYGVVIHPGTSLGLYQEVRKAMAKMILEEFAGGGRFSTMVQKELLLYEAQWFLEGLIEYAGTGWTYDDARKLAGAIDGDVVGMAVEGNGELNRILRKSIWHYIVHEYGAQKISEIVYLVNISHSLESGVISVLGITLNTLTLRWERYIKSRTQNLIINRFKLGDYGSSIDVPLPKGSQLAGMDFDPDSNRVLVNLNRDGAFSVQIYNLGDRSWVNTPIKSGFKHADANRLTYQAPVKWHPDGNRIYAPVWRKGQYLLAMYDLEEKELSYRDLPKGISQIYQMDFSHNGNRLAFSGLHKGRVDIFAGPSKEGRFIAYTNDPYDNLEPSWSDDDQSIFFSSNRDQMGRGQLKDQLYAYQHAFDLYQLIMTGDTALWSRLTNTPGINERFPEISGTSDLIYLTDRSGIVNLESLNIYQSKIKALTNLGIGLGEQHNTTSSILLSQSGEKGEEVFILEKSKLGENSFPDPTIQRLEDDARRKIEEQKKKAYEQVQLDIPPLEDKEEVAVDEEEEEVQEKEKEKKQAVRYYIFDDEDEPYEVRKPDQNSLESNTPSSSSNRIPTTVFGKTPKPELDRVSVTRPSAAGSPWKTEFLGLNFFYDPISTLGVKFDLGLRDLAGNHELEASWIPFIRLRVAPRDHIVTASYAYKKNKIDLIGEAGLTTRFLWIQDVSTSLDSLIFRYNKVYANVGGRLPLSAKSFIEGKVGIIHLDRLDQRLTRLVLLNDRDNLVRAGIRAKYENVEEKDGFKIKGFEANASADYYYSLNQGQEAFYQAKMNVNYYRPVYDNMVLSFRLSGAFSTPRSIPQYYLGGVPAQLHSPIVFQRRDENRIRANGVDTALYALHFAEFVTPMRGFGYNTRSGSRYLIANLELRIPVSRLLRYSLQPSSLYNIEIIPFIDAGTVWTEGNPFSQRRPTDTQFLTSGNVTIKLQTLKSPFLIGMGTGLKLTLLNWSARFDLAWGLDDFTLQRPQLTTSLSKNF